MKTRPRTPEADQRSVLLSTKVTPAEAERIRAECDERGVGVSAYLRDRALAELEPARPSSSKRPPRRRS